MNIRKEYQNRVLDYLNLLVPDTSPQSPLQRLALYRASKVTRRTLPHVFQEIDAMLDEATEEIAREMNRMREMTPTELAEYLDVTEEEAEKILGGYCNGDVPLTQVENHNYLLGM